MHTLVYFIAAAVGLAGVILVLGDYPVEKQFPALGPALIGIGVLLLAGLHYLYKRER